jgi:hypothetical protein
MRHHGLDVDAPDCFRSLVVPRRIRYDVARMEATLKQLIHNRLDAEGADAAWRVSLLAACEVRDALDQQLGGAKPAHRSTWLSTVMPVAEPPGAYLRSIGVEGFWGIGPRSTLTLKPGPGLTLVVGRNGSGKSSFAEGLESMKEATSSIRIDKILGDRHVRGRYGTQQRIDSTMDDSAADCHHERPDDSEARD